MSHSAKTTLATLETTFDEHAVAIAKRQYFQESDASLAAMFERVANWVATPEQIGQAPHKHAEARQRFFDLMAKKRFCPGGRVLAGAATNHGNVLNCFVQDGSPEREGTTDWVLHLARKLALVTKVGGGNGVNLDPLPAKRPYQQHVGTLYISIASEHADFAKVRDGRYMDLVRGEYLTKGYRFAKYLEQAQQVSQQNILRVGDSVEEIWQAANQAVRILLEGQDVVLDLSDLRPEGTPVMGSGGNSSGPSSFAVEVFDNFGYWASLGGAEYAGAIATLRYVFAPTLRVIRQGGSRRGAGMATMSVTHPDIQDFITCKDLEREQAEGDISTFNISVLVDDSFMQAQSESQILRDIAEHAWQTGEPGLIFIDRINEHNPMRQSLGDIKSTNPCVTADTKILTSHGEKTVAELRDKPFEARFQGQDYAADKGFWSTGVQAIFELRSDKNLIQCTAKHRFLACPAEAYRNDFDWQEAGQWLELAQLNTGDKLAFSNNTDGTALESVTIESITAVGEAEVFDTTVKHVHRYISNGFISHNCGEIPLYAGEPCDLGAMNLSAYVRPISDNITKGMEQFDFNTFADDVQTCVRFLDNVLEVNRFALEDNRLMSQRLRRLGLGVMGLADALIKMGYRYDSSAGRAAVQTIIAALRDNAHYASQELANERGTFPDFAQSGLLEKRRNIALLTVAPTGTTSMLMGVSSGVEPIFAPFIYRKIGDSYAALISPLFQELLEQHPAPSAYQKEGSWDWDKVVEKVSANHGSVQGLDFIPEAVKAVLVCAHDISPEDHVRMQGVVQRTFDADGHKLANSISKTINMPNSASVDDVFAAYKLAYEQGCKGITVYRDGSRQFQVLSTSKESSEENNEEQNTQNDAASAAVSPTGQSIKPRFDRPARLTGFTDAVKLTMPTGEKRGFYVTVNKQNDTPSEVFIISGKAGDEAHADAEALGRLTSIALQYGVPAEAIVKTLRGINGGMYGSYQGRMVGSKADIIAIALETAGVVNPDNLGVICPDCDAPLRFEEGCQKCESCGYSKCG